MRLLTVPDTTATKDDNFFTSPNKAIKRTLPPRLLSNHAIGVTPRRPPRWVNTKSSRIQPCTEIDRQQEVGLVTGLEGFVALLVSRLADCEELGI